MTFRPEASQAAMLCYLDDTNASTGALRVLPGSHLRSAEIHAVLPDAHREVSALAFDHAAFADHPDHVTLELHAGDAVLVDYRLLHGTHPNTGDGRRDCVLLNFAPAWRDLPDDVRGPLDRRSCPTPRG